MAKITNEEIKVFSKYIYEISGILLDQSKGYLIETRLRPMMKEANCKSFSELFYKVKSDSTNRLQHNVVDAISTNETFFFRDSRPFDLLRNKIIPDLIDRRRQKYKSTPIPLRIWSAACSSGQEVYSIAITLKEMLPNLTSYNITINGTDISDRVIAQASYGKYTRFEMERGLPKEYLHKYFKQTGSDWRIKDEIRVMAQFHKINLLKPFPAIGTFDIIFCRNVAIYFSQADRQKLFKKFATVLEPDGALLLGGSESLSGLNSPFESKNYLRAIYYQKKGWEKNFITTPLAAKKVPFPRPEVQIAPKTAPKVKPVTGPPKPAQVKQPPLRPQAAFLSPRSRKPMAPSLPPATSPITKEKEVHDQSPPQSKKSLLSALQEKKKRDKNHLIDRQTVVEASSNEEPKKSLLDKIASRQKKKKDRH